MAYAAGEELWVMFASGSWGLNGQRLPMRPHRCAGKTGGRWVDLWCGGRSRDSEGGQWSGVRWWRSWSVRNFGLYSMGIWEHRIHQNYLRSLIWQQSGSQLGKGQADQRELFLNLSNGAARSSWAGVWGESWEEGTDRQMSQRQIRVLPCQEDAAKATGRTGPTGTGIEWKRTRYWLGIYF